MNQEYLLKAIQESWSGDTTDDWHPESPDRHQCAVSALVIQDHLGGIIIVRNKIIERHVWFNVLPDGSEVFAFPGYSGQLRKWARDIPVHRGLVMLHPGNMPRRYQILQANVTQILQCRRAS